MKFSNKLLLPILAVSLIASSAFAGITESQVNPLSEVAIVQLAPPAVQWVGQPRNRWQRFADWVEVKSCTFNPLASLAAGLATGIGIACTSKNNTLAKKLTDGAVLGFFAGALTYFDLTLATCLIVIGAETD